MKTCGEKLNREPCREVRVEDECLKHQHKARILYIIEEDLDRILGHSDILRVAQEEKPEKALKTEWLLGQKKTRKDNTGPFPDLKT